MPKFQVTHRILRAEFATVEVTARTEKEAARKGKAKIDRLSTADYEPGDVVEEDEDVSVHRDPA